ncbi:Pseudouridylate synthase RPUSD2 [Dirofilaria immitis]
MTCFSINLASTRRPKIYQFLALTLRPITLIHKPALFKTFSARHLLTDDITTTPIHNHQNPSPTQGKASHCPHTTLRDQSVYAHLVARHAIKTISRIITSHISNYEGSLSFIPTHHRLMNYFSCMRLQVRCNEKMRYSYVALFLAFVASRQHHHPTKIEIKDHARHLLINVFALI